MDPSETATEVVERPLSVAARGPRLVVFWQGGLSSRPLPEEGKIVLGRSLRCDVPVDHSSISRQHAALHVLRRAGLPRYTSRCSRGMWWKSARP